MISFNHLGNLGRLGNQMFQYAALRGIAANRNFSFATPNKEVFGVQDAKVRNNKLNLYDVFALHNEKGLTRFPVTRESSFKFSEFLYNHCPDNVDLYGYFQTEKYFASIKDDILQDFSFAKETVDSCRTVLPASSCISLHIRRGDYKELANVHPVQPLSYYEKALTFFDKTLPVLVFSDDKEWCQSQALFKSDRFFILQGEADKDLCMMSLCDYHIIANSSYSWWGAYLARSKGVVAPSNWFTVESRIEFSDIYCEGWLTLDGSN